jgi:hypothetical protein
MCGYVLDEPPFAVRPSLPEMAVENRLASMAERVPWRFQSWVMSRIDENLARPRNVGLVRRPLLERIEYSEQRYADGLRECTYH